MRLKNRPLNSESFSEFFRHIPIPTFAWHIVGEELVLIDFNDATEKLSFEGISLGIKASELFKDDKKILTNLFRCLREKSNFSEDLEVCMKTTDELKILSTTYTFLLPDLVIFHVEDITMQKQVKKALQKARDVLTGLELIINQSPAVVILIRNEEGWPVEYITDNIRQFGYEPSDFYSHILKFADLIHPDDLKEVITESYLKCQNGTNEFVQEYRIISKLGVDRWINIRTWVKRDKDNNITHFQGIILDITERRQTEEKLKESEEKFRKITEQSLFGVAIFQKGTVKYINKALVEIAEFELKEVKNWPINEFVKSIYPEDLPMVMEQMQVKLEENKDAVSRYIFRIITKSKKIKWLEILSKTIRYQGELAILGTLIDVTEKQEAEIKLKESEENLKKLNESLEHQVSERTIELKESEEKYRSLYNNAEVGLFQTRVSDGKMLASNQKCAEMLAYDDIDQFVKEYVVADHYVDPTVRTTMINKIRNKGYIKNYEAEVTDRHGIPLWWSYSARIYPEQDLIEGVLVDISERKKTEQKLKESEKKYREIIESIEEGYFEVDLKGNYIFVNDFHSNYFGYSKEEMIGANYREYFQEEEVLKIFKEFNKVYVNNLKKAYFETIVRRRDGQQRYNEGYIYLKYNSEGEKVGFFGFTRDITERKKAEQKLRESEANLITAIENLPFAFFMVDKSGRYIMQNTTAKKIWGDLIGKKPKDIAKDEETLILWLDNNSRVFSGETIASEAEYVINGELRYFYDIVAPVYVGNKIQNILGVNIDITERKEKEDELRLHSEMMKNMNEGVNLIRASDLIIVYANPRFEEMFGYNPGEIIGKHASILNAPTDKSPEETAEEIMMILEKSGEWHGEIKNIRKDSTSLWSYANISFFNHPEYGKVFVSILTDITERKNAESQLRFLLRAVEQASEGIAISDLVGKITFLNKAFASKHGYTQEELIGKHLSLFHTPEQMPSVDRANQEIQEKGEFYGEIWHKHRDGPVFPTLMYNSIILDDQGEKIGMLGTFIDITEQKEAEQKLGESEEKYRTLFESCIDGIVLTDIEGRILDCNEKYSNMLGYTREELKELTYQQLTPEKWHEWESEIVQNQFIARGYSDEFEKEYIKKDGTVLPVSLKGWMIKDENGNPTGMWGFVKDITNRKKAEQELEESEEKYKEAYNKAEFYKDIFTHDINNILSNIKTSIELSAMYLKDPNRIHDVEKLYEVIRGQFKKGSSLVSNIRKLSQIEETVSLVKPVELNDVLKKEIDFILKIYQTREVKIRTHGFEKEILVNANDLLIDLFSNLLNNSIKYNDSQVVEIDIKAAKEKKNNTNYIKLEFLDNGIGIQDKRKETLFEKDYVKDISSKGLGIGLTLVKKIVESYRGEIWVEDRIEGDYRLGTNFIVLIPEAL